jgi:hypothetical protein
MMPVSPAFVRSVPGRCCPVCTERHCADPAECLWFLTSRPWADCSICDGLGCLGDGSDPALTFCEYCMGSGLNEYTVASVARIKVSEGAKQRHAAHIARLTALVLPSPAPERVAA